MYANCNIAEVSMKTYNAKPKKGWNRYPFHTDVTYYPRYYIVRKHELPCKHGCNLCNVWYYDTDEQEEEL